MKAFLCTLRASIVISVCAASALAEEKNGLLVTVQKTTLDRADQRTYYYADRINRTEGLKVSIKNVSFKPMPEGEVQWQILNRKHYSTTVESTNGTEKLKALKPADMAELTIGAAEVTGWRDGYENVKDKLEWQVTILQGGKEVMKTASTGSFDAVAKRAVKVTPPKR